MNTNLNRRAILKRGGSLGLAGVGLMSGLTGLSGRVLAADVKVNIVNSQGNFTLVRDRIFEEIGFYDKLGVSPDQLFVSDGSKILASLISGGGDICTAAGFPGVFPAIEKGAKIKIVAGSGIAPNTQLFANNDYPEIQTMKDLVGRNIGIGAPGALLHMLTVATLKKHGIDPSEVNFVNIGGSPTILKALAGGTVEAGVAPSDALADADGFNVHPIVDGAFANELPLFTNQAMFASDTAIAEKRDGLVRVLAANAAMFRWIANTDNKDLFIKYYLEELGSTASEAAASILYGQLSATRGMAVDLVMTKEEIDYVQNLNIELGVQESALAFDDVADMSLAQDAIKLLDA